MTDLRIQINGMTCQHCVMRVKQAIESLPGINDVTVEIGTASISFDASVIQQKEIEEAIVTAGYTIRE
ncbi:MAG: cation transporter [Nitrospiraceae bacterium]|nr:MAG: cation transporter [Nitrospiraceae bacterium]